MSIPHNIKLIRQLTQTTQTEFGALFGASKAMIVSYESGKANPDDLMLNRLAERLGLTKSEIERKTLSEKDLKAEKIELLESAIKQAHQKPRKMLMRAEGSSEIAYLETLIKRFQESVEDKERIIEEKEARLRELQEHKQDWKDQNKELMNLMKAQLNTLAGSVSLAHKEILTEIKASMRWEARRLAGGDKKKEKEILAELGTIVGAVRDEFWPKGNVEAGSM